MNLMKLKQLLSEMSETRRFLLAGGAGAYALAIAEWFSLKGEHSGRWSWFFNWTIEVLGAYGVVYLWAGVGTLLLAKAFMWKKEHY